MNSLGAVKRDTRKAASARRAAANAWYFKTGPGEYGEGDRFLGVTLPQLRSIARTHRDLPLKAAIALLQSRWHEERLLALLILDRQGTLRGDERTRRQIHQVYLGNTRSINNWDLVDSSASQIVGAHLENTERSLLRRLARSTSVWGTSHRDDRDTPLHQEGRVHGRVGYRNTFTSRRTRPHSTKRSAGC